MRIILPESTYGDAQRLAGGQYRVDLGRPTMLEIREFQENYGPVGWLTVREIVGRLEVAVRTVLGNGPDESIGEQITEIPALAEALCCLIWIVRHRAGERQPNGSPLTRDQVLSYDPAGVTFELDPGDVPEPVVEAEQSDPPTPRRGSNGRGARGRPQPVSPE